MGENTNLIDLKNLEIEDVLESLSKKRPLFHYETDFQFSLAWEIKNIFGEDVEVRLEYFIGEDKKGNRQYIDILVMDKRKKKCIPIELKYKTRQESDGNFNHEGIEVKGETFVLKNQSADNDGRYLIYKDIERIQNLINGKIDDNSKKCYNLDNMEIVKGYVIFLTNVAQYGYIYRDKKHFNTGISNIISNSEMIEKYKEFNKYLIEYKAVDNKEKRKVNIDVKESLSYNMGTINKIKSCDGYWSIYSDYDENNKKDKEPMKYVYQLVFEIKK